MLAPVFVTLKASQDVKNIVGTNPPRIWPHGEAPQDGEKPYITWQEIIVPENTLSETPTMDRASVQIDCWHQTSAGITLLARAVRDAIEPVAHMTVAPIDQREPETRLYRRTMQFDFFMPR